MVAEQTTIIKSINPATQEVLGEVPVLGRQDVDMAVERAWRAYEEWRLTDYKTRGRLMLKLRQLMVKESEKIAELITREMGKPLVESLMAELHGPLDASVWFAENTQKLLKDQAIALTNPLLATKQSIVLFEPLGVIGIISPWNYPFAIPVMSIIMALMAGNTVVLKPSEKSSLIGIRIGELFLQAGFPPGAVTVITGDRTTGQLLCESKLAKLVFTGSVEGGKQVMSQAAKNLIPVSLELGGKDPAIVLPDAPPDWTARGLVWGAFTNCGQACASVERAYVVKGNRTDELIQEIVNHTRALKLGSGMDPATQVGPLIDKAQLSKVKTQVEEARAQGAKVLCGGISREDLGGFFYEPTVLTNVTHSMRVMQEETFGPVLPIMIVDSEDAAIELANDSQFGLCASIWTRNLERAEDIAEDLDVGTVLVNDGLFSFACPQVPWGGLKKSGSGRTHSYFGLLDLVNIKHVSIDSAGGMHRQWWYPYNSSRINVASSALKVLHSNSLFTKLSALWTLTANFFARD